MQRHKVQDLNQFPDCCALSDTGRCIWLKFLFAVVKGAGLNELPKKTVNQ